MGGSNAISFRCATLRGRLPRRWSNLRRQAAYSTLRAVSRGRLRVSPGILAEPWDRKSNLPSRGSGALATYATAWLISTLPVQCYYAPRETFDKVLAELAASLARPSCEERVVPAWDEQIGIESSRESMGACVRVSGGAEALTQNKLNDNL